MIRPVSSIDYASPGLPGQPASRLGTVGLMLFLAALTMLFGASLLGYLLVRHNTQTAHIAIQLPKELWVSTVLVIGVSIALWRSVVAVQRERRGQFHSWLIASLVLGIGFIAVQTPAMISLLSRHRQMVIQLRNTGIAPAAGTALYGLIFVLVLLHALHVVGGIVALVRVVVLGWRGQYDHEHYQPVRHAAMYWHFLDVVWIVMFSTFLLTR